MRSLRSLKVFISLSLIVQRSRPLSFHRFALRRHRDARDISRCTLRRRTEPEGVALRASSTDLSVSSERNTSRWPLERSHERGIFAFHASACSALWILCGVRFSPHKAAAIPETFTTLLWSGMIMAVSFTEAWVKFRAPFLRKHVAVDVGRHVFAALNSAELALCLTWWVGRIVTRTSLRATVRFLPVTAAAVLLFQVLVVAPRLYTRAKAKIVDGFENCQDTLTAAERSAYDKLSEELRGRELPSPTWHRVYGLLELVKVVCLQSFAFRLLTTVIR